jgi:2-polyprenyl-3-methyl-5-hydroxy-6-metoxy-1,4-benzoquinol methylase
MNTSSPSAPTSDASLAPDISYYQGQRREMLEYIPGEALHFLELGCGGGGFAALLRESRKNAHVSGVEIHPESAQEARKRLDVVIEQPVEVALASIPAGSIDCVVCNDVLEHLVDPWAALSLIRKVLRPNGAVVASIPNVRHFPVFKKYFLNGDWKYEKWGVLDRTHLRFFTKKSIEQMFSDTGFRMSRIEGIFAQPLPWKASLLNRALGGKLTDMQFERFACVALLNSDSNA